MARVTGFSLMKKMYLYFFQVFNRILLCSLLPDMYQRSTLFLFHSTRAKASWGETLWVLRRLQNGPILHRLMCSRIHTHCGNDQSLGSILFFSRTEDPQFSVLGREGFGRKRGTHIREVLSQNGTVVPLCNIHASMHTAHSTGILLCSLLPDMYQRSTLFLFHSTRAKASWGETLWVLRRLQNGPILHRLMCSRIHTHCGNDQSLGSILFFSRTEDPQFSPCCIVGVPCSPPMP